MDIYNRKLKYNSTSGFTLQRLGCQSFFFMFCIVLSSCKCFKLQNQEDMLLECILTNFIIAEDNVNQNGSFLVGQHDHWGDSTSMIIVSFIPKDKNEFIQAEEKSRFNQYDVYFYRTELSTEHGEKIIRKIPNQLKWQPFEKQYLMETEQPPFDPITIQVIYNYSRNCFQSVLAGEEHLQIDWKTKCRSCPN